MCEWVCGCVFCGLENSMQAIRRNRGVLSTTVPGQTVACTAKALLGVSCYWVHGD